MTTTPVWRQPIWLLGHLVALAAVVGFVRAGVWQLDRLEDKQVRNRTIAARADGPAIGLGEVDPEAARYQRVRLQGRFVASEEVLIPYRSYEGTVGSHVVTPFAAGGGATVLVNRGWVPNDAAPTSFAAPDGDVEVEGLLLAASDRRHGVDVTALAEPIDGDVYPLWLSQTAPAPAGDYPIPLPPPARDEGPHRAYAIQWFLFASVVVVGYPILLRRRIRQGQAPDTA